MTFETSLANLASLADEQTRCITAENPTGAPGMGGRAEPGDPATRNVNNASRSARDLGRGWKVNPYFIVNSGETVSLADIQGPGVIRHIWMTPTGVWRFSILRIYWDDETTPSVEVPLGDFFCQGWDTYAHVNSAAVCVNPGRAFNCYWPMPFRRRCRMTIENVNDKEPMTIFYRIDYALKPVADDQAYFHAQFRRTRYNETSDFTIVDGIRGRGHFVGTYLAWGVRNNGWWGEGEEKFFIDDDDEFPTICGTGLEDYFCGSYNFDREGRYQVFTTPYAGLCQVICPDGAYQSQQRFGLYRWHIPDPVRFTRRLRMTIQDLGWRHDGRYLQQHSDIAATSFWYQAEPHAAFPTFPGWRELETL
ncbi:MAG: glycoside hydrolase family 172 protein [Kiritimatiellia bacterium]|jgi:hypothetical protein